MSNKLLVDAQPQKVKKFYFLDYFYILLKSVQRFSNIERIFEHFLSLKQEFQLGESKYKRLSVDDEFSPNRMVRYRYTFEQVLSEALDYKLVGRLDDEIKLLKVGEQAIDEYQKSFLAFNQFLFGLMEQNYHHVFHFLLSICYSANDKKHGLLIFPIYSPNRLGFERKLIKTTAHLMEYFYSLQKQLERDVNLFLGQNLSLESKNQELIDGLIEAGLISGDHSKPYDESKYVAIVKRCRDFWLKYFLQDLYNYPFSLNSFEILAYRGKQIGIFHITEFYPNFHGRVVYPLAILKQGTESKDFCNLFRYSDGMQLLVHQPKWDNIQEEFVKSLVNAYFDSRETAKTYFVNLSNIRERVCYNMKIPEYTFDEFLGNAYQLSLADELRIRISLEVDKLPEETNAMYLKRAPVMVEGKYRNIIAVDIRK